MQQLTEYTLSDLLNICRRLYNYRGIIACRDGIDTGRLMNTLSGSHLNHPIGGVTDIVRSSSSGLIKFQNGSAIAVVPADYKPDRGTLKCNRLLFTEQTTMEQRDHLDTETYIITRPYLSVDLSADESSIDDNAPTPELNNFLNGFKITKEGGEAVRKN